MFWIIICFGSFSNILCGRLQYSYKRNNFWRDFSDISVEKFRFKLRTVIRDSITNSSDMNKAYDNFIEIFSSLFDDFFPKKKMKLKPQKYNNPRITKGIKKSSKRKQIVRKILKKQK